MTHATTEQAYLALEASVRNMRRAYMCDEEDEHVLSLFSEAIRRSRILYSPVSSNASGSSDRGRVQEFQAPASQPLHAAPGKDHDTSNEPTSKDCGKEPWLDIMREQRNIWRESREKQGASCVRAMCRRARVAEETILQPCCAIARTQRDAVSRTAP